MRDLWQSKLSYSKSSPGRVSATSERLQARKVRGVRGPKTGKAPPILPFKAKKLSVLSTSNQGRLTKDASFNVQFLITMLSAPKSCHLPVYHHVPLLHGPRFERIRDGPKDFTSPRTPSSWTMAIQLELCLFPAELSMTEQPAEGCRYQTSGTR